MQLYPAFCFYIMYFQVSVLADTLQIDPNRIDKKTALKSVS
jgi:hypothetical protein